MHRRLPSAREAGPSGRRGLRRAQVRPQALMQRLQAAGSARSRRDRRASHPGGRDTERQNLLRTLAELHRKIQGGPAPGAFIGCVLAPAPGQTSRRHDHRIPPPCPRRAPHFQAARGPPAGGAIRPGLRRPVWRRGAARAAGRCGLRRPGASANAAALRPRTARAGGATAVRDPGRQPRAVRSHGSPSLARASLRAGASAGFDARSAWRGASCARFAGCPRRVCPSRPGSVRAARAARGVHER